MIVTIKKREETDHRRLAMETDLHAIDRGRAIAGDKNHVATQWNVDHRLDLDEKRLELESNEFRGRMKLDRKAVRLANEERQAMIELIKKLTDEWRRTKSYPSVPGYLERFMRIKCWLHFRCRNLIKNWVTWRLLVE